MPTIELNPVIRSQEFITVEQDNRNEFRLRGSFVLPAEKRALIGIRKEFASQCPDGFTESPGGYFYFYLNGDGEENEVDQVVEIPGQTAHGLRMFVKLWEGDGPLKLELENIKLPDQVAIIGGCCSRDTFEYGSKISVSDYRARTSFAGLASPAVVSLSESVLDRIPSAFQRRMVKGDLLKESLRSVILAGGSHVITDFMIERTKIFYAGESIVTWSEEFSRLGTAPEELPGKFRLVVQGSEEYFELFRKGWKYAVEQLTAAGKTVIVNEIRWATENDKGEKFDLEEVTIANAQLDRLYEIVKEETPAVEWINYDPKVLIADSGHKWGPSPFHFVREFYESQLSQIGSILERQC